MKREILKLNRKEKKNLIKLINAVNELLDIDNPMKIKNTIKKLDLDHEHTANMEFEYGKNLFVKMVDYIFYGTEINGVTFNELSEEQHKYWREILAENFNYDKYGN